MVLLEGCRGDTLLIHSLEYTMAIALALSLTELLTTLLISCSVMPLSNERVYLLPSIKMLVSRAQQRSAEQQYDGQRFFHILTKKLTIL